MSGEHVSELSEDLREWVESRAAETGQNPEDVLSRAVTAYQILEQEGEGLDAEVVAGDHAARRERLDSLENRITDLESLDDRIAELESLEDQLADVESLDQRVEELDAELDEKIDDVRERVIQVKKEADSKAPTDHDHEQLRQRIQRALRAAEGANATSQQLGQRIERIDEGLDNFEEVLEYLTDTTDELENKLDALAYTVIDLRERLGELEGTAAARDAAADLKDEANRESITTAKCAECASKVQIGLLSTPRCPHCGTTFREVEPAGRLFGSARLQTGDQPALQGETSASLDTPEDLFDEYDAEEGR
jgi:chromosome segregation ATPase